MYVLLCTPHQCPASPVCCKFAHWSRFCYIQCIVNFDHEPEFNGSSWMKRAYKDVLIFGKISFEGIFCKANSKLSQSTIFEVIGLPHYLKDIFNEFVLWKYSISWVWKIASYLFWLVIIFNLFCFCFDFALCAKIWRWLHVSVWAYSISWGWKIASYLLIACNDLNDDERSVQSI